MWRYLIIIILLVCGCATVRDAQQACEAYVSDEVAEVFRQYERYRDRGFREGLIGQARGALERAREALNGEPMLAEAASCPKQGQRRESMKDLRADVEVAEALVAELEAARGVRFLEIAAGRLVWVDSTTGKPIPVDFADSI